MGLAEPLISRAFRLLGAFAPARQELTLGELTSHAGLPRSTVHRLAGQLEAEGALVRTARGWRLGSRLFELGQLVPTQQRLRERALPHMGDLFEATHQTIQLAVLEGSEVLYVEVLAGHNRVRTPSRRGGRMPAHCTALGKALLAFSGPGPTIEGPLERRTRRTITDLGELAVELREVRRSGIAYDREEAQEGLSCVAAPIIGFGGKAVAAISVAMPARADREPELVAPAVRLSALALGRELSRVS